MVGVASAMREGLDAICSLDDGVCELTMVRLRRGRCDVHGAGRHRLLIVVRLRIVRLRIVRWLFGLRSGQVHHHLRAVHGTVVRLVALVGRVFAHAASSEHVGDSESAL